MIKLRTLLLYDSLYIVLSLIAILYSYMMINYYPYHSKYTITDKVVEGYIHSLKIDGNKLSILMIGKEKVLINYYFDTPVEKERFALKLGDTIRVDGEMTIPKENTVFNLFNYRKYLYRNHIFYIMKAEKITKIHNNTKIRYAIKQKISAYIDGIGKSSPYIKALVIGNDDDFTDGVNKSYQFNGVSHLFAISGSHISFLAVIVLWFLKKIRIEENKRYYIIIVFLFFYMFLTDYAGSVVRAVVFFIVLAFNKMYYFNIKTVNVLQLSLFILLLLKPSLLYDIGFQFSFLISLYLIMYQALISRGGSYLKQTFIISLIAFLAGIPICINSFFQINLLSPFINVFFVPYVSFILFPLAFICLLLPFLDSILFVLANVLEYISLGLSHVKIGEVILSKPSFLVFLLYYIVITLCIHKMMHKKYLYFILLMLLMIIHTNINYFNTKPNVVFIDVGQGDCTLINLPFNKGTILLDTGGKISFEEPWQKKKKEYHIGEDTIIPYLKSIGIKKVDYLILSHGDEDHMGESKRLINNFKVGNVIFNCGEYNDLEKDLIKVLDKKKIKYHSCINELDVDNNKFYFLNTREYSDENNNSSVIYAELNNYKFLLMGDAGIEPEKNILEKYNLSNIDFLKVGHHGSYTSSSEYFINNIKPKYSMISVGANNRFGHPKESTLDTLSNSKIYRTDLDGSIEIKLNKNGYKIRTCNP